MPYPDRSIAHHKGLWIKNVGKDLIAADEQLRSALATPDYPGSSRDDPQEYIHTSLAATILAQVQAGITGAAAGFERVMEHLERASSSKYFNANQSHVKARTLLEMANIAEDLPEEIALACLNNALEEIERSLQMIGAAGRGVMRYQKALGMFEDLQRQVVASAIDMGEGPEAGARLFANSKSQIGYEFWSRKLLAEAISTNTGSDYKIAADYIDAAFDSVASARLAPVPELRAIRVDLIVRWRLQQAKGAVDWDLFHKDLEQLLLAPKYRDDSLKRFYYAVALYHRGGITEANAVFAALRRDGRLPSPSSIRCFYVGPAGFPRRFQGIAQGSRDREYVNISELGDDVLVKGVLEVGPGGTVHVYVAFAGNGPVAVTRSPGPGDLLMPAW
jgi:hypothetical protein